MKPIVIEQLIQCGITPTEAQTLLKKINACLKLKSRQRAWQRLSTSVLNPSLPFSCHEFLFSIVYPEWQIHPETAPACFPSNELLQQANLSKLMVELNLNTVKKFHQWSVKHFEDFWQRMITQLNIIFFKPQATICDLSNGVESPKWLPGAKMNIAESCFTAAPEKIAIISQKKSGPLSELTYGELNILSNRVANSLIQAGFVAGNRIAIIMSMSPSAVAIYLGIIKMGGVVISIADSFSANEIASRLKIADAKAVFTEDYMLRNEKMLPLYEKIIAANAPKIIVLSQNPKSFATTRKEDMTWQQFLSHNDYFAPVASDPMSHINILFSSGTTGEPKAIPWNHTTAIKAASDAYLHMNIVAGDRLAWPTNLGWMMGPWLIFAALINNATIALFEDAPTQREFGQFIQDTEVTILGVIPTLVAGWRQSNCMAGLDWSHIKSFSSTGECSNATDMLYLMSLAGYKPVIEYCGGTEIGGSYITSTVIQKNYPSLLTTPAMGIDFVLLHEDQDVNQGDVALIPPSIGLSTELLNGDHHQIYYANMPKSTKGKILRRHGDQIHRYSSNLFVILGRSDDTMNLGGIKTSAAEIERILSGIDGISEVAAVAVPLEKLGPNSLVIFAVNHQTLEKTAIKTVMQHKINQCLNPLFKIYDVVFVSELPRTASNKIMRRVLRKNYSPS